MTTPQPPLRTAFTVKGWHVAAGVVAFFVIVVGVDMAFLVTAYRTHPGQVEARPYETGLIYNAELERQRAQAALGWRAGAEARDGDIEVVLKDRDGVPLDGLTVSALLQRPATEQGRTELKLTRTGPGRYAAAAGLSGTWDARIEAADAQGRQLVAERRLTWP